MLGWFKVYLRLFPVSLFLLLIQHQNTFAQDRVSDFRSSNQRLALIGFFNELVEPSVEDALLKETRQIFNKYTRTYGDSSISSFKLLNNPNNEYFKTADGELPETQKEYLLRTAEDNKIDIFALGVIRESFEGVEMELQLFDSRIQTLSEIERKSFNLQKRSEALEEIVYKTMNYLDREGYVNPSPQDFLSPPAFIKSIKKGDESFFPASDSDKFISPEELSPGRLAGQANIGGEKTPFWERTWFWGVVGGSLLTVAGLSYYFLVVDQPPSSADVTLDIPRNFRVQ